MEDLYGSSNAYSPTPSSDSASLPLESEDLSTFLQQFLHPASASSSCMPFRGLNGRDGGVAARIGIGPSSSEINFGGYFEDGSRKGFSFMGGMGTGDQVDREFRKDKDSIDFRFDNENGGGSASEFGANPVNSRSSLKRSRAAEVHNLSEKRRRSRINEKLKALQKLIPNYNKSDKASMLDEAIEYLKQLQLQVQMLSMRNGVSLHPLCMPGVAQPLHLSHEGTSYDGGNDMLLSMGKDMLTTTSAAGTVPLNQDASVQPSFENSNHGNSSNQPVQPTLVNIPNSEIAQWDPLPTPRCCRRMKFSTHNCTEKDIGISSSLNHNSPADNANMF